MTKVVDDLKTQMQNIQYYSLLQKLFISYIFKHLEGQIDSVNKNSNLDNFKNLYKNNQNKFNHLSAQTTNNNQFPFFGAGGGASQDTDFLGYLNANNNFPDKDSISFIKQMQNSGLNFTNSMGSGNMQNGSGLSGMPAEAQKLQGQMPNMEPSMLNNNLQQGQFGNQMNNPMELLKNLHSSINCQLGQNQSGPVAAKLVNSQQQGKVPQQISHGFATMPGVPGLNIGNPGFINAANINSNSNNSHSNNNQKLNHNSNVNNILNQQQQQQKNILIQQMTQNPNLNNANVNNSNVTPNFNNQQQIQQQLQMNTSNTSNNSNNNNNQSSINQQGINNNTNINNQNQLFSSQNQNQNLFNNLQYLEGASVQQHKNQNHFPHMGQSTQNAATSAYVNQSAFNQIASAAGMFGSQGHQIVPGANQAINQTALGATPVNAQNPNINNNEYGQTEQTAFNQSAKGSGLKEGNSSANVNVSAGFHPANVSQQQFNSIFQMYQNQQVQQSDFQK